MTAPVYPIDIIVRKRDGMSLTDAEVQSFVRWVVERTPENPLVTDPQIASFLMAVFHHGLNSGELAALTEAMRTSGEVFDAAPLKAFIVDKHSTGGVGDKTSLLIAPILAAAGIASPTASGVPSICVPMMSGRSLGHTGGTLDKLEAIPGFNTQLSLDQLLATLKRCGAAMIGQTPALVPADRVFYALRDHTGTVESPFLLASSIMSKKLAEDLDALVLDVKTGSGAFLPDYEQSRFLAELMVQAGEAANTRTVALLTSMDQPLGRFAGNWVEVWECIDIMKQKRHPLSADLITLTNVLAGWMLYLAGQASDPIEGARLSDRLLLSGAAFNAFLEIVRAQEGDTRTFEGHASPAAHHKPSATRTVTSTRSGFLAAMDCRQVGLALQRLGAGRSQPGGSVSAHAGIEMHAKLGDPVRANEPLITLFSEDAALLDEPERMIRATLEISSTMPKLQPLVHEVVAESTEAELSSRRNRR